MKRKVLYITGTRADYGLMRSTLGEISRHPGLELELVVTGMHLMPEFGMTVDEVRRDGFTMHVVDAVYEKDSKASMAAFAGRFIQLLAAKVQEIRPDVILLLGDRGEMLAGAIVGAYMSIPVAHIHGGEITSTVDNQVRHAITMLANIHFPATAQSASNILAMGESPASVFVTGAPGLDGIREEQGAGQKMLSDKYGVRAGEPFIMVVQHPVTMEVDSAAGQMRETLEAVLGLGLKTLVVYPNADAGGRKMIKVLREYEGNPLVKIFQNIPHDDYIGLLRRAKVLVGNSSSGIIEAPSLHLPVVNVGTRQQDREAADCIINVGYDRREITEAVRKALYDEEFRKVVRDCVNPYGSGTAGKKIAAVLATIPLTEGLMQKRL